MGLQWRPSLNSYECQIGIDGLDKRTNIYSFVWHTGLFCLDLDRHRFLLSKRLAELLTTPDRLLVRLDPDGSSILQRRDYVQTELRERVMWKVVPAFRELLPSGGGHSIWKRQ